VPLVKSFPAKASAKAEGGFTALVSVFGNVDMGGDVVEKGAFERTLAERGLPPIYYSHQWQDPPIGAATDAKETEDGLVVDGRLFVDVSQRAAETHAAMAANVLKEFSFAYDVVESSTDTVDGQEIRRLTDVELYEVGPTIVGMNPATELIDVRSAIAIRSLRNGEKLYTLEEARAELGLPPVGKAVIAFRDTPKAPEDTVWDAHAEVARADVDDLRAMCAWYDLNEPGEKGAYRLPHHRAEAQHPVVWRGVITAMTALLAGSAGIPGKDREEVYDHLARHYRQFDREPPDFRSLEHRELSELRERRALLRLARPRITF
jgi:HK97 family phage prohead protease